MREPAGLAAVMLLALVLTHTAGASAARSEGDKKAKNPVDRSLAR